MVLERISRADDSLFDAYDRVLDKGILVDPSTRLAMAGALDLENGRVKIVAVVRETPFRVRGDPASRADRTTRWDD